MKRYLFVLICIAMVGLFSSCTKSKAEIVLDGFEELIEDVEKQKGKLTVEEWGKMQDDFNKRFEELGIDDIDESDFSVMQKMKLVALGVRWTAVMAESAPSLMESAIEQAEKETESKN